MLRCAECNNEFRKITRGTLQMRRFIVGGIQPPNRIRTKLSPRVPADFYTERHVDTQRRVHRHEFMRVEWARLAHPRIYVRGEQKFEDVRDA